MQAEFLANLTDLERLAEHYALKRLELIDSMTAGARPENALVDLQRIDDTFASLTRLYVSPRSSTYPGWVADVEPITAALLLRYAGLDPTTLGHVSNDLVVRWRMADPYEDEGRELPWWSDYDYAGPNTADIVFELLLATPGASTVYVIDAAELPESMWFSADDPLLAQRVALQGTDPRNIGPAAAGTVLRSFIEFSLSDRYRYSNDLAVAHPTGYTTFLGTLVAPWMLQFASKNTDWDCVIDSGDRTELLRTVLEDDGALAALTAANNVAVSAARRGSLCRRFQDPERARRADQHARRADHRPAGDQRRGAAGAVGDVDPGGGAGPIADPGCQPRRWSGHRHRSCGGQRRHRRSPAARP